jgi:membrane associated rhomboid family serine protease
MDGPEQREPIFNVPGAVLAVLALLIGLHVFREFLSPDDDLQLVLTLAFIPARLSGHAGELPGGELAAVTQFVTHMLVHADMMHLLFNSVWLLAFGSAIAKRNGGARFLAFAVVCGVLGAVLFLAVNPGAAVPVIGASGAISGLMGGAFRLIFSATDTGGLWRLREAPETIPLMPLRYALVDRRVMAATAIWLGINALAIYGIGGPGAGSHIAWEAHIGGFLAGILTIGLFERPGTGEIPRPPGPV